MIPVRPAHGAKKNRVRALAQVQRFLRKRMPGRIERGAADQRLLKCEIGSGSAKDFDRFCGHLGADTISAQHCDLIRHA